MDKKDVLKIIKDEVVFQGKDPEYDADFEKLKAAGFKIETVEQKGGESQGSEYYVVLKLDNGQEQMLVKCDGYYASYEGISWDTAEVYEVEPKMVEVRQWAAK
jgi:hypothetical protein